MKIMKSIERIKKGKYTVEITLTEEALYRFSVYSVTDSVQYVARYTTDIQIAYTWLTGVLVEWAGAISLYKY